MYCRKCGRQLEDGDVFCAYCGTETGWKEEKDSTDPGSYEKREADTVPEPAPENRVEDAASEPENGAEDAAPEAENRVESAAPAQEKRMEDMTSVPGRKDADSIPVPKKSKAAPLLAVLLAVFAGAACFLLWMVKTGNDPFGLSGTRKSADRIQAEEITKEAQTKEEPAKEESATEEPAEEEQTEEATDAVKPEDMAAADEVVITGGDVKTDAEAKEALKQLWEEALDCVRNGDKAGFSELYRGEPAIIDEEYDGFKNNVLPDLYPTVQYAIIESEGNYFAGYIVDSVSSGAKGGATNAMWHNWAIRMSNADGIWKFDFTEECREALAKGYFHNLPEEAIEAFKNGRNATLIGTNSEYLWADTSVVIPMNMGGKIYALWENEDGSLGALLYVSNGSDTITSFYSFEVSISSDRLGNLVSRSFQGEALAPFSAKNITLTIPREELPVDISGEWGKISTDVHYHYN